MSYTQFIAGEFRPGTSVQTIVVTNPADETELGHYPGASERDVQEAIDAAGEAWRSWRGTSALERSALLRRTGALIRERRNAIAERITRELGKPFGEAQREVDTAAEMFEWAAEEARRLYGRTIPSRTSDVAQTVALEPIGPVAAFAGWNAPAITPARKISSALGAGCTIVIKPSEETPGVALAIARAAQDAGVPDGVLNMVFGDPAAIAGQLLASPTIAMATFTGATAVGKRIGEQAAATMKRATLELGGHAPVIVCADTDVDRVAAGAVAAKFRNAGQVCTSPTRFLIEEPVFDAFSRAFAERARALKVGDPFAADTRMGPLKNARRLVAIERLVQDAADRGGTIVAGGGRLPGRGYFHAPTVVRQPDPVSDACSVEPFGPLALLVPVPSLEAAIEQANRLPFGLAAYAFTNSLASAHRLAAGIESGAVCINEWQASLPETPFGGYKDSGLGSEGGVEGLREFLRTKCVRIGAGA